MIERAFAERFGGPDQFPGREVDCQQTARIAHQHQVAHGQRMQAGESRHFLIDVALFQLVLHQLLDRRMMGHADSPAGIEQRTPAAARGIVRVAAIHQPIFAFDVMDFSRLADLIFQPGQRLRIIVEQLHGLTGNAYLSLVRFALQRQEHRQRLIGHARASHAVAR